MKNICFLFLSLFGASVLSLSAQQTINGTIMHDGLERAYILYVPEVYNADEMVPLVLNFHGYTSTAGEQMFYGNFRLIADTANFLIVHPMGTEDDNGTTHWNVGWGASTVDDVGFTAALLDTLSANYAIDQDRVYSTGMSNGGFMSYLLACELSDRIAAIASVTGAMNLGQTLGCSPEHPMPVMEIHGTADGVVPYETDWALGSEAVIDFWVDFNECNPEPVIIDLEDVNTSDGSTVEWRQYQNENGIAVELFKVHEGGHTWPGTIFAFPGTNYDINASREIWRFFSQYTIHGLVPITNTEEPIAEQGAFLIHPNPATEWIEVKSDVSQAWQYRLSNLSGQVLSSGTGSQQNPGISLRNLPNGTYLLQIENKTYKIVKQD